MLRPDLLSYGPSMTTTLHPSTVVAHEPEVVDEASRLATRWLRTIGSASVLGIIEARATKAGGLCPGPELNAALGALVGVIGGREDTPREALLRPIAEQIASSALDASPRWRRCAHRLRRASARAENRLELHHADRIRRRVQSAVGPTTSLEALLGDFPYLDNYVALVAAEVEALRRTGGKLERVVVAGAGPLPLTGLWLAHTTDASVVLVDCDALAVTTARELVRGLERVGALPRGRIEVVHGDVRDGIGALGADFVLVASLVDDDAKVALARRCRAAGRPLRIGYRGARGLVARLAYRPLPSELEAELSRLGEAVPAQHGNVPGVIAWMPRGVLNTLAIFTPPQEPSLV
ncbi:MAG: nicotianamine synthase family protein [Myxococcota bacterium]